MFHFLDISHVFGTTYIIHMDRVIRNKITVWSTSSKWIKNNQFLYQRKYKTNCWSFRMAKLPFIPPRHKELDLICLLFKRGIDKKCFLGWGRLVNSIYHSVLRNLSNLSIIWCTKYWGLNVALIRGKPCYQPIGLFLWTNFTALGVNQLMSLVISKHMAAIW